ncbi:glycine betaine/proline transport system ATP-binding protein [Octadecabacter temperatus]|uniref:Glycine betaine/L-proline transport ATP-binding protein ProV n=1 Tax=Octadecabacter temperatus TaxID=1458307 RepID=A0A0K0Y781_9RHOB|nr:choline ABC transporter ATP-binding protein [Octadecabacter temperatus]AKS46780.1 Glycine betaine/L-proline transport ATP-binding protein ProV [Octadecabacter temperatus]SIO21075.1 glycine betaine/proline transport system ATP-binding protein [Octadecabacter temperatus]
MKAVEFKDVSIVFGDKPESALPLMDEGGERAEIQQATGQVLGVHNCSLDVDAGEILVLMGLSGSGKSTLLRAVNGLNPVVRGGVVVHDGDWACEVGTAPAKDLRKLRRECVSMVFQQFGLLPWRTVRDNVGLGLELAGMSKADKARKVDEQLELVGLSDRATALVGELSGGMQQRVGLARAFVTDAPILLMDEPFSALDPLIRTRLQDELLDLQQRLNRTIIFVSHDLDEAFKIGNRIAIMEGGRIVQCGTPREIFSQPANGYVADFVANMNPLGVLCARDVMIDGSGGHEVDAETPVSQVIDDLCEFGALTVTENGTALGQITQRSVLARISPREVG